MDIDTWSKKKPKQPLNVINEIGEGKVLKTFNLIKHNNKGKKKGNMSIE